MPKVKAGDVSLEYYVEGSGPPLLMIMGFGGQAASWGEPFLQALRPHFTLIRFSNRGTGDSDRTEGLVTVRLMADDTAALVRALEVKRPHVFGVSMGGMIAQELVLTYPELVNGLVLGCTTAGGAGHAGANPQVLAMLVPTPGLSREEQIRKAWPALCSANFIQSGVSFLEAMLRASLEKPTPIETLAKQMAAIQGFDSYERLPQIKAPTRIVHGDADVLVPPENGRLLHQRIAGSELVMLPGAGHMFFWEQPAESARAIVEFLSRVTAPAGGAGA